MIIYNTFIPVKGFRAMNLCGIIFARKEAKPLSDNTINHEKIHTRQIIEMAVIFFYLWYILEWLIRLVINGRKNAYRNVSFEREAYRHQADLCYPKRRKPYTWVKHLK